MLHLLHIKINPKPLIKFLYHQHILIRFTFNHLKNGLLVESTRHCLSVIDSTKLYSKFEKSAPRFPGADHPQKPPRSYKRTAAEHPFPSNPCLQMRFWSSFRLPFPLNTYSPFNIPDFPHCFVIASSKLLTVYFLSLFRKSKFSMST